MTFIVSGLEQQINIFEEKVQECEDTYNAKRFHDMITRLKKQPSIRGVGQLKTIASLRKTLTKEKQLLQTAKKKSRVTEEMLAYFEWYVGLVDYFKMLFHNFENRIHMPLQTFFKDRHMYRDDHSKSAITWSRSLNDGKKFLLKKFGCDYELEHNESGFIDNENPLGLNISSYTREKTGKGSNGRTYSSDISELINSDSSPDLTITGRSIMSSRRAVSGESADMNKLVDNLGNITAQWELLVSGDAELHFSSTDEWRFLPDVTETNKSITGNSQPSQDIFNLICLVPQILSLCFEAAKLARRWLEKWKLDTCNLKDSTGELETLQQQVPEGLKIVNRDILFQESELAFQTRELEKLLKKEERSDEIMARSIQVDRTIASLRRALKTTQQQHEKATTELLRQTQNQSGDYENIKSRHDAIRVKTFMLRRQIKVEEYRRSILEQDLEIEMELKPIIINYTNDVQEKCEKLEHYLEDKKKEKRMLERTLWQQKSSKGQHLDDRYTSWPDTVDYMFGKTPSSGFRDYSRTKTNSVSLSSYLKH